MGKNKLLFRLIKLGFGHGNIKKVILKYFIGTKNIEWGILFDSKL